MTYSSPYGTHQHILIEACRQTDGPIIELGCGDFSTPVLNDTFPDRRIISVETNEEWMKRYAHLETESHTFTLLKDFSGYVSPVAHAAVLFIDFAPGEQRREILLQEACNADFIVIHDTEAQCYGWGDCWKSFKYVYQDLVKGPFGTGGSDYSVGTSVVSNFKPFTVFHE